MAWFNKKKIVMEIAQEVKVISSKSLALEIVVSYVSDVFSKTKFKFTGKNAESRLYFLNNSPNINQSAQSFLKQLAENMILNGEALVFDKDDQFIVADSFYREEHITGDMFKNITVGQWTSPADLKREDVLYLRYKNSPLESFVNELWGEYGKILSRLIANQKIANQVRATIELNDSNFIQDKEAQSKLKEFTNKIANSIRKDDVVFIPKTKNGSYDEVSAGQKGTARTVSFIDQIDATKKLYVKDIAGLIGFSSDLIFGEKSDNQKNYDLFIETVIEHLQNIFVGELNKTLDQKEFGSGMKYSAKSVKYRDIFELATSFDKLISSGSFNRNELRAEVDYDPIPDGEKFLITKNYMEYAEGGVKEDVGT